MRGNPIVELIAILVMLASVLVGGAYWGVYKTKQKEENVLQTPKKEATIKPLTFEQAHKRTEL